MNIKTKFNEGDMVFTIDTKTLKAKGFEVGRISTLTVDGDTHVMLYEKDASVYSDGYDEKKCFPSEAELITFVTTKDDNKGTDKA